MIFTYPLVSCICLTDRRTELLKRSVECFLKQTYPNKELVVVSKANDVATSEFIRDLGHPSVVHVQVEDLRDSSIGTLRNAGVDAASGEFVTSWDDDDWYHSGRLLKQFAALKEFDQDGCALTNIILFDSFKGEAYLSHTRSCWEATLLVSKKKLVEFRIRYPALSLHEDTQFATQAIKKLRIYPYVCPILYIYVCHGTNTSARDHFKKNFEVSLKLSSNASLLVKRVLEGELSFEDGCHEMNGPIILRELRLLHSIENNEEKEIPAGSKFAVLLEYMDCIRRLSNIIPRNVLDVGSHDGESGKILQESFKFKQKDITLVQQSQAHRNKLSNILPTARKMIVSAERSDGTNEITDVITGEWNSVIIDPVDLCVIDLHGEPFNTLGALGNNLTNVKSLMLSCEHNDDLDNGSSFAAVANLLSSNHFRQVFFKYSSPVQSDSIWIQEKYLKTV
jgi:glycosyltransferase involved in cell wall biosynthesis